MKNKKFTYFLGFLVLLVWGLILYRVFNAEKSDEEWDVAKYINNTDKEPYNDYAVTKDTAHLLLNYNDPFSLKRQTDTPKAVSRKARPLSNIPQPSKPAFSWSFIKYSGYIRNPGSKDLVAVVQINGKTVMMSEGETAEQVRLIKNLQDSIKVTFNGKTTFIKMQSGAL